MNGSEVSAGIVVAYLVNAFIDWFMRRSPVAPWTEPLKQWVYRVMAWTIAGAATLGIHFSFDAAAGTLMVTGLTWASLGVGALEWLRQIVSQELIFDLRKASGRGGRARNGSGTTGTFRAGP